MIMVMRWFFIFVFLWVPCVRGMDGVKRDFNTAFNHFQRVDTNMLLIGVTRSTVKPMKTPLVSHGEFSNFLKLLYAITAGVRAPRYDDEGVELNTARDAVVSRWSAECVIREASKIRGFFRANR